LFNGIEEFCGEAEALKRHVVLPVSCCPAHKEGKDKFGPVKSGRMASRCARPAGQTGRTESQGRRTRDGRGRSIRKTVTKPLRKDRASAPTGCHDARRSEERMGFGGRSGAMGLWLQSLGPVGGHPCPRQKPVWP